MEPTLYHYSVRSAAEGEIISAHSQTADVASVQLNSVGDLRPLLATDVDAASALLRQCIRHAVEQSLTSLQLHSSEPLWRQAALAAGFSEQPQVATTGGPLALVSEDAPVTTSQQLAFRLPPNRQRNASSSPLITADGQQQIIEQTDRLLGSAERFVDILSDDLEPWLYNRQDLVNLCLELLHRSNRSRIRVLIRDSENLLSQHHRLVNAHLRANERLQLKKVGLSAQEQAPQMVLVDEAGLLLRQQRQSLHAIVYDDYRQRQKLLKEQFEQLWQRASPLAELASKQW